MKLIVGLGNPGKKYEKTWHNAGFMAVEKFRQDFGFPAFKVENKFNGEISEGRIKSERILLLKPGTFMNLSGSSVKSVAQYYKIKVEDIIIVHDDIDLLLGTLRFSSNSSSGGHNGIKSIIEELGTKDFKRLKIGVKTERLATVPAPDYVLEKPAKAEANLLLEQINKAISGLEMALVDFSKAMNAFN